MDKEDEYDCRAYGDSSEDQRIFDPEMFTLYGFCILFCIIFWVGIWHTLKYIWRFLVWLF